jgi:hypothetical protein
MCRGGSAIAAPTRRAPKEASALSVFLAVPDAAFLRPHRALQAVFAIRAEAFGTAARLGRLMSVLRRYPASARRRALPGDGLPLDKRQLLGAVSAFENRREFDGIVRRSSRKPESGNKQAIAKHGISPWSPDQRRQMPCRLHGRRRLAIGALGNQPNAAREDGELHSNCGDRSERKAGRKLPRGEKPPRRDEDCVKDRRGPSVFRAAFSGRCPVFRRLSCGFRRRWPARWRHTPSRPRRASG